MYEYSCKIIKVVDGDTVDVDIDLGYGVWLKKQRIRLYGVDTPESRTRDLTEKKFGLIAKEFVLSKLPLDSMQTLRTRKDGKGKYGRILGEFVCEHLMDGGEMNESFIQETTVNDALISEHLAVKYMGQSKNEIEEEHIKNRERVGKEFLPKS